MTLPVSPVTFTGPVTVNVTVDAAPILAALAGLAGQLDTIEGMIAMTAPTTVNDALTALGTKIDTLTADEASDRGAFDALAVAVRAFIVSVQAGGALTAEQSLQAQTLLDHLDAADTVTTTQTTDEAALQAEVPATPAP